MATRTKEQTDNKHASAMLLAAAVPVDDGQEQAICVVSIPNRCPMLIWRHIFGESFQRIIIYWNLRID